MECDTSYNVEPWTQGSFNYFIFLSDFISKLEAVLYLERQKKLKYKKRKRDSPNNPNKPSDKVTDGSQMEVIEETLTDLTISEAPTKRAKHA